MFRSLVGFLFPHRWRGDLAEAERLLASSRPSLDGLGRKIDAWLESPGWLVRNAAVKLIARVNDHGRLPRLIEKLRERGEAGIVRRNAAEALGRMGLATEPVRAALLAALSDRYWEVRAEAIRSLARLFAPAADLERALLELLFGRSRNSRLRVREENFEVRMAIAQGLGHLGVSREALRALVVLAGDEMWLVRSQAAVGLAHLAARLPQFADDAAEALRELDRLSEGAVSYFVHRDVLGGAMRALRSRSGPEAIATLYLDPKKGWNHVRRPVG